MIQKLGVNKSQRAHHNNRQNVATLDIISLDRHCLAYLHKCTWYPALDVWLHKGIVDWLCRISYSYPDVGLPLSLAKFRPIKLLRRTQPQTGRLVPGHEILSHNSSVVWIWPHCSAVDYMCQCMRRCIALPTLPDDDKNRLPTAFCEEASCSYSNSLRLLIAVPLRLWSACH